ncbi:MAG: hypothetical protein WD208_06455 [Dehalococcoidia bacterium]
MHYNTVRRDLRTRLRRSPLAAIAFSLCVAFLIGCSSDPGPTPTVEPTQPSASNSPTAEAPPAPDIEVPESFFTELVISIENQEADSDLPNFDSNYREVQQWWYEAPDRLRQDREFVLPSLGAGETTTVVNSEGLQRYDNRVDLRQHSPEQLSDGPIALSLSYLIGPLYMPDVDTLIEAWADSPNADVSLDGEETILGRRTDIIKLTEYLEDGTSVGRVSRAWIDPELMWGLRNEIDDRMGGHFTTVDITALDYNQDIADQQFDFAPPEGSTEGPAPADGCNSSLLLGFDDVPGGYASMQRSEEGDDCHQLWRPEDWQEGDEEYIYLRQRVQVGGIPAELHSDSPVTGMDGLEGFRHEDGATRSLVWAQGDVVALLTSNTATFEELQQMAMSAE